MIILMVVVSDIMIRNVFFVKFGQAFVEIVCFFVEMDIYYLFVIDEDGKLIGIISVNDVMCGFSCWFFNSFDGLIFFD